MPRTSTARSAGGTAASVATPRTASASDANGTPGVAGRVFGTKMNELGGVRRCLGARHGANDSRVDGAMS